MEDTNMGLSNSPIKSQAHRPFHVGSERDILDSSGWASFLLIAATPRPPPAF